MILRQIHLYITTLCQALPLRHAASIWALSFLEHFSAGLQSPSFGPTFLMVFLALLGIYLTLRGIVMHSIVGVIRQTESAQ